MRTGLAVNSQVTREYQHTNRRVTIITPHPRFTSCRFQLPPIDEQIEKKFLCPFDIFSAISAKESEHGPWSNHQEVFREDFHRIAERRG